VAYRNSTIFSTKFKAPSRLWVRCLRSRIWASSHGQTRLGRHIRSQREKQHNTVSLKAQRRSPRGQAYRNYTIFCMKFKPPSQLWVGCLRGWIWASSHGQTRLGRHSTSQRKKQQKTINMKARWSSPRGQNTSRKPNFALFASIFLIFFSDSVSLK
jgi:hypothetical protein